MAAVAERERVLVSCSVPYGRGGLGQHLAEIVEIERPRSDVRYYAGGIRPGDESIARVVKDRLSRWVFPYTPLRFSIGWRTHFSNEWFDRAVAGRLAPPIDRLIAFAGQALHSFHRARALGCRSLGLVAPTGHVNRVAQQDTLALRQFPGIERPWLNEAQRRKTLREYEVADTIYVGSEYARQSFLEHGTPAHKLSRVHYKVASRFVQDRQPPADGVFRIVYTGAVTLTKGAPVLLNAFSRLPGPDIELRMVGGSTTRGMRRFLDAWRADTRIRIEPGDPLPHLRRADVYVHPSYQDGFGYAPMEALACGVPVIVTHDTGMKEHVVEGVNGYVVPTGDVDVLVDRLTMLMSRKLAGQPAAFTQ